MKLRYLAEENGVSEISVTKRDCSQPRNISVHGYIREAMRSKIVRQCQPFTFEFLSQIAIQADSLEPCISLALKIAISNGKTIVGWARRYPHDLAATTRERTRLERRIMDAAQRSLRRGLRSHGL